MFILAVCTVGAVVRWVADMLSRSCTLRLGVWTGFLDLAKVVKSQLATFPQFNNSTCDTFDPCGSAPPAEELAGRSAGV